MLDLRPMPFFDLIFRWVESSDFGQKSDDLGHRILKLDFIPSYFAKSDCISRPIPFSDRKIKIRSSESDRILISLRLIPRRAGSISWLYGAKTNLKAKKNLCLQPPPKKSRITNGHTSHTWYATQTIPTNEIICVTQKEARTVLALRTSKY